MKSFKEFFLLEEDINPISTDEISATFGDESAHLVKVAYTYLHGKYGNGFFNVTLEEPHLHKKLKPLLMPNAPKVAQLESGSPSIYKLLLSMKQFGWVQKHPRSIQSDQYKYIMKCADDIDIQDTDARIFSDML